MANVSNIRLSPEDRVALDGWVADRNTPQKLVWRARIVLMWADGAGVTAIVRATGKTKRTAYRWRDGATRLLCMRLGTGHSGATLDTCIL